MNRASSLYAACQHTYHCIATATREGNERNHSIGIHARYPPVRLVWLSCRPSGTHLNKPSLSHSQYVLHAPPPHKHKAHTPQVRWTNKNPRARHTHPSFTHTHATLHTACGLKSKDGVHLSSSPSGEGVTGTHKHTHRHADSIVEESTFCFKPSDTLADCCLTSNERAKGQRCRWDEGSEIESFQSNTGFISL